MARAASSWPSGHLGDTQFRQGIGDTRRVPDLAVDGDRLFRAPEISLRLAHPRRQVGRRGQRSSSKAGSLRGCRQREEIVDPTHPLAEVTADAPVVTKSRREPQPLLGFARLDSPAQRRAEVVVVVVHLPGRGGQPTVNCRPCGLLGHHDPVLRQASAERRLLAGLREPLETVLPDRLEHP